MAYIGIDIGGSNTRVGLFQSLQTTKFTLLAKFATSQSYTQQLEQMLAAVQGRYDSAGITGVGVSIAGRLAKDGRSIVIAPNLPAYVGKALAQDMQEELGCSIRLAHDPVCGILAEKKFGYLLPYERCAYLTVSTGTGAAIQLSKASTTLTSSIEIGHQILDGNQRVCLCGQVGCLETFTGGKQLEMRYGRSLADINESAFWDTFCAKLALGLVNLAMLTRVDAVALSGAIVLQHPQLLPMVQQQVHAMLRWGTLDLDIAATREDAPLIGAALLIEIPEEMILH